MVLDAEKAVGEIMLLTEEVTTILELDVALLQGRTMIFQLLEDGQMQPMMLEDRRQPTPAAAVA